MRSRTIAGSNEALSLTIDPGEETEDDLPHSSP